MVRPTPRRSSRIGAIQPSSSLNPPTPPHKKRKYYVISDSEPPHHGIDSDSSIIQVSSPPSYRKPKPRTISSTKKARRSGVSSPKSASKRMAKRKERYENEGTQIAAGKKEKESRDVAVGPDESMWTGQVAVQKDSLDIVKVAFMDEMTCSLCLEIYVNPITLTKCGHTFCEKCVKTWLTEHSTCPECRAITSVNETFQNRGVQRLSSKFADMILSKEELKERTDRKDKEVNGMVMTVAPPEGEGEGEGMPRRPQFRRWESVFRYG